MVWVPISGCGRVASADTRTALGNDKRNSIGQKKAGPLQTAWPTRGCGRSGGGSGDRDGPASVSTGVSRRVSLGVRLCECVYAHLTRVITCT